MEFNNSSNNSAILKENYPGKKKRKKRMMAHYADGGAIQPIEPPDDLVAPSNENTQSPAMNVNPQLSSIQAVEPSDEDLHDVAQQEKYGSNLEGAKAFVEGVGEGIAGPFAPMAEQALGVNPEDIVGRREVHPYIHAAGQTAGLLASSTVIPGEGLLLNAAGETAVKALGLDAAKTAATRIAAKAVRGAAEVGLFTAGDDLSKLVTNDPNAPRDVQTAIAGIGLSSALGAGIGGALGTVPEVWSKAAPSARKLTQFIDDMKGQAAADASLPNPVESVGDELQSLYSNTSSLHDEVYGTQGLKAQNIEKVMPEFSPKMMEQAQVLKSKLSTTIEKMRSEPKRYPQALTDQLESELQTLESKTSSQVDPVTLKPVNEVNSGTVFDAIQDTKQQLQSWGKFSDGDERIPLESKPFRMTARNLSHDFRTALEDSEVWGDVAKIQSGTNSAYSEFKPTLKNFKAKFVDRLTDQVDPGKVNTFINQLEKPNGEIKKEILQDFLASSQKYGSQIDKLYGGLGLESPIKSSPLAATNQVMGELTPGGKAYRMLASKVGATADTGIGAVIGGYIGHTAGKMTGIPYMDQLGIILGAKHLGAKLHTIIPSIGKAFFDTAANARGLAGAGSFINALGKGLDVTQNAVKNVFKASGEVLPSKLVPSTERLSKLSDQLKQFMTNPQSATNLPADLGTYMPNHQTAYSQSVMNAINYVNNNRPDTQKKLPLDQEMPASPTQKAKFNTMLQIADSPLIVLDKIKKGTLTLDALQAFKGMYPDLYNHVATHLMNEVSDQTAKGNMIPYKLRLGISMFIGQPLDSTMTPFAIQQSQNSSLVPQAPQISSNMPKRGSKSSGEAVSKSSQAYQTPLQSRASHDQKR